MLLPFYSLTIKQSRAAVQLLLSLVEQKNLYSTEIDKSELNSSVAKESGFSVLTKTLSHHCFQSRLYTIPVASRLLLLLNPEFIKSMKEGSSYFLPFLYSETA